MAATRWDDGIRKKKVLTVFPTKKVTKAWRKALDDSITTFNKLNLNVSFEIPPNVKEIPPDGEDGAEVQFDLGNGTVTNKAHGTTFTLTDAQGQPVNFSGLALHGSTQTVKISFGGPALIRRAFITVPETPQVNTGGGTRLAGPNIMLFIAFHELIHATGLPNADHSQTGPDADGFTTFPTVDAGALNKPQDDKMILNSNPPRIFAPPMTIKKRVADLIKNNWA